MTGLREQWTTAISTSARADRRLLCEQTRWAYWTGQNDSGRKRDKDLGEEGPAFPWDGASDTRIRLADEICNDEVALLVNAFYRAQFTAEGIGAEDVGRAGGVRKRLEWARGCGIQDLEAEAGLAAQYSRTYGWTVLHVLWERRLERQRVTVGLDQVRAWTAEEDSGLDLAGMILDPTQEEAAAELVAGLYPGLCRMREPGLLEEEVPELGKAEARRHVRELREAGETEVGIVVVARNAPRVVALKPYEEVFYAAGLGDLQRASAIFRVDWFTEDELRGKVLEEGWDAEWVEKVIERCKGLDAVAEVAPQGGISGLSPAPASALSQGTLERETRYQVVYGYERKTDQDGVSGVWCTVFSMVHGDKGGDQAEAGSYGKYELVNYAHGEYPFVALPRERVSRRLVDSRGVPEIVMTWQGEAKTQRDACFDRTSISLVPPLLVPTRNMGKVYRLSPAGQIGRDRPGDVEWMRPPSPGTVEESMVLTAEVRRDVARYFHRRHPEIDAVETQVGQQRLVNEWLGYWVAVFRQIDGLMEQFLQDDEWERISGEPAGTRGTAGWRYDWRMRFDVRELDAEFMTSKLKAFTEFALATDAAGVVDRAKLTALVANAIDPTIARAVIQEAGGASQALFRGVREELAQMALGNEAQYVEDDPAAGAKLGYLDQIVKGNPKYQAALTQDPRFEELVAKYTRNLEMSVEQGRNRMVGRIGVRPGA
jgi:hypothetical protein